MLKRIVTLIIVFGAAFALASCTSASKISPDGYANQGTKVASGNAALSSYEQKEKIEDAGIELLDELDEEYWMSTAEFLRAIAEHFEELSADNPYAMDAFEEWSEGIEDAMLEKKLARSKLTIRTTAALSKLEKGTFREKDGVFEFTPGLGGVKIVTYVDGKTVTINITNGAESKTYELYSEHWESSGDWDTGTYEGETYTESDYIYGVKIPSWIKIEITEGAASRLSWKADFKFTDANGNGKIELEKDKAEIDTEIKAAGYTLAAKEKYYPEKGVAGSTASSAFYKGTKLLVATALEGCAELGIDETGYHSDKELIDIPKSVKAAIDILGKVQAKGTIDYEQLEYLESKLDPYGSDKDYERTVSKMEKCIDVAIYYDKKSARQAWLGLEPFYNERYKYWTYEPVIRFADDSSYMLDEFFNEDDFSALIRALNNWAESVDYYFGLK